MSLTTTIKSIQDIMRKDAGVDGDAQRITQLGWMLFVKIFDDREREYEALDPTYRSVIPEELRWRKLGRGSRGDHRRHSLGLRRTPVSHAARPGALRAR